MTELPALPDPIGDGVVQLRGIEEWDIPEILIAYQDDPALTSATGRGKPPSGAELGRQVENAERARRDGHEIELTVVRAGERDCIGRVAIGPVDWAAARTPIRVWLVPAERGDGLEDRAITLASAWLADRAGLTSEPISAP